jgi:beta-xylosidase
MKYQGKFYLYREGGNDIMVAESTDLINWTTPVSMLHYSKKMWAPEVHNIGGTLYAYFAIPNLDQDTPEGESPDRDIMVCKLAGPKTQGPNTPVMLVDNETTNIDPTVYQEDGDAYLLWKHNPEDPTDTHIRIRKLNSADPTQFGEPAGRRLYRNPPGIVNNTEHPELVRMPYEQGGQTKYRYYLFYSNMNGKTDNYRTDYATSNSLTGTFTRQGIVLQSNPAKNIYSTGAASVVIDGGNRRWFVYRTKIKLAPGEEPNFADRQAALDRVYFNAEAGTVTSTPTRGTQAPECPTPLN